MPNSIHQLANRDIRSDMISGSKKSHTRRNYCGCNSRLND